MNWYTIKAEFKKNFPDWTVEVCPPCISDNRNTHYIYDAMAYALGKKSNCTGYVDINEIKKKITYLR